MTRHQEQGDVIFTDIPWQVDNDTIDVGEQYMEQGHQGHSEGLQ
jgi:hypothetical protein